MSKNHTTSDDLQKCFYCGGTGRQWVYVTDTSGNDMRTQKNCVNCGGSGKIPK